jgi:hypothetical protein
VSFGMAGIVRAKGTCTSHQGFGSLIDTDEPAGRFVKLRQAATTTCDKLATRLLMRCLQRQVFNCIWP